jgi:TPR repeat protein
MPSPDEAHMINPEQRNATSASNTGTGAAAAESVEKPPTPADSTNPPSQPSEAETAKATEPPPTVAAHPHNSSIAKPPKDLGRKKTQAPTAPSLSASDDNLVQQGEAYLYGDGVPQNCDHALRDLKTAAGRSHVRAMGDVGTMYATGHCVTRDLPTAYRWFARALHKDPGNGRIQQDLEVLWRQMSAGERQLAMQNRE